MNNRPPKAVYPHVRKYQKDGQTKEFSEGGLNFVEHAAVEVLSGLVSKEGFKTDHLDAAVKLSVAAAESLYAFMQHNRGTNGNNQSSGDAF